MKTKNTFFMKNRFFMKNTIRNLFSSRKDLCYVFLILVFLCFLPTHLIHATSSNLDNTKTDWWLVRAKNHQTPGFNDKLN